MVMAMMGIVVQLKEWYDVEDTFEEAHDISDELSNWYNQRYMSEEEYNYDSYNKGKRDEKTNKFNKHINEIEDDY